MGHISRCTLTVNVAVSRLGSTPAMDLETLDQRLEGWARFEGDGLVVSSGAPSAPEAPSLALQRSASSARACISSRPRRERIRARFLPS